MREDDYGIPGREPEPVDVVIAEEREEQLQQGQPERYRRIIQLKAKGYTNDEIGNILHLNGNTVRRFLNRLLDATVL